jgi:hypothetical protein
MSLHDKDNESKITLFAFSGSKSSPPTTSPNVAMALQIILYTHHLSTVSLDFNVLNSCSTNVLIF